MRPGGLLLGVHPALRPVAARVLVAGIAVALLTPAVVVGAEGAAAGVSPSPRGPAAAPLPAPPGTTRLVSRDRNGGPSNGVSREPSISANGRFIAFTSGASDLVGGDTNEAAEVFLADRETGRTIRLPVPGGAVPPGGTASQPSIAADGSVVVFRYEPPPSTGTFSVVVARFPVLVAYDRHARTSKRITGAPEGPEASGPREPSVSGDGRYVAFTMNEAVTSGSTPRDSVLRYDLVTGRTVRVSQNADGRPVSGQSRAPSISADGNLVAFLSDGGRTVAPDETGKGAQVFVRDVARKTIERISVAQGGGPANNQAQGPAISGNGRYVAFASAATNLVDGPGAGSGGLFRRDRRAQRTIMVSLTPAGTAATGASMEPSISADGNFVAFTSLATDLVPATSGPAGPSATERITTDVFLRDIAAGETVLVSVTTTGASSVSEGRRSFEPSLAGGRFIAFASTSPSLVRGDSNEAPDVFLRDLPPAPEISPAVLDLGSQPVGSASLPAAAVLRNAGWSPLKVTGASLGGPARRDFRIVADGCRGRLLRRDEACTVSVQFKPVAKGTRTATLAVADSHAGSPRTVRLRGQASQAKLVLDPRIGPPGFVTIAKGAGFPPGARVRLSWSEGITPPLGDVVADANGSFRVQVLVFHNDVTGPRDLVAEPVSATAFPAVSTPMLVTPGSTVPPAFAILRIVDLPFMLVIRG